jgi:hypothetical protein
MWCGFLGEADRLELLPFLPLNNRELEQPAVVSLWVINRPISWRDLQMTRCRGGGRVSDAPLSVFCGISVSCSTINKHLARRGKRMHHTDMPTAKAGPKLQESITIAVTFGSDIQRDVGMRVLTQVLEAWKQNLECAHKRNRVTITQS